MDWTKYIQKTKDKPPRALFEEAITYAHSGFALDIGGGNLADSKKMLEKGFKVTVVDPNVKSADCKGIEILSIKIEDFIFPIGKFSFVNAQDVLLYTENISSTMKNVFDSLESGGIFSGQFFGEEDGWSGHQGVATHTREEVEQFFASWKIIKLEEERQVRGTAHKSKFWHVFHVIARKR